MENTGPPAHAVAMRHFGLYERDNKQKPFYMPPEFIFIGVPERDK